VTSLPHDGAPRQHILTVSNALSFLRLLFVVPFVLVLLAKAPWSKPWAIAILVLAALTDKFDGVLARKYHQETEWGRILDPLADKIAMGATGIVFMILGYWPVWFVLSVLARDLLIFIGGSVLKIRTGRVLPSNLTGKWALGVMSLLVLAVLIGAPDLVVECLLWASVAMLITSFVLYVRRFAQAVRPATEEGSPGNA
jgi:CDP-diacylglycerol--glycerol-3-phosphate 3-phosphatidyltransferase